MAAIETIQVGEDLYDIGGQSIQVTTMPTASEDYENEIYQYIGDTDVNFTNGYFYKCIEDPDNTGSYIWVQSYTQGNIDLMPAEDMSEIVTPLPSINVKKMKYSTEEQVVGEWIDGKPIYQKTVVGNSSTNIILEDSVSPNIEQIIDMKYRVGWLYSSEHMYYYQNSYKNDNNIFRLAVSTDANWKPISINPMSGSYFANKELIVTIQYTKTTD